MSEEAERDRHLNRFLSDREQFNTHQADNRARTDMLAKSIFLLSGGALTISIGIFLRKEAPEIPADLICLLKISWFFLALSIVAYIFVLSLMIIRDYFAGERWRERLDGKQVDVSGSPGWWDRLMWYSGVIGVTSFLAGFSMLCWFAMSLLGRY